MDGVLHVPAHQRVPALEHLHLGADGAGEHVLQGGGVLHRGRIQRIVQPAHHLLHLGPGRRGFRTGGLQHSPDGVQEPHRSGHRVLRVTVRAVGVLSVALAADLLGGLHPGRDLLGCQSRVQQLGVHDLQLPLPPVLDAGLGPAPHGHGGHLVIGQFGHRAALGIQQVHHRAQGVQLGHGAQSAAPHMHLHQIQDPPRDLHLIRAGAGTVGLAQRLVQLQTVLTGGDLHVPPLIRPAGAAPQGHPVRRQRTVSRVEVDGLQRHRWAVVHPGHPGHPAQLRQGQLTHHVVLALDLHLHTGTHAPIIRPAPHTASGECEPRYSLPIGRRARAPAGAAVVVHLNARTTHGAAGMAPRSGRNDESLPQLGALWRVHPAHR